MGRFILHEPLAVGYLNLNYCSAAGALAPWAVELTSDERVCSLMCQRLVSDYENASVKMRKAFSSKDLDTRTSCP